MNNIKWIKYEIWDYEKHKKFIPSIVNNIDLDVEKWLVDMLPVTQEYIAEKLKNNLSAIAFIDNTFIWFWAIDNVVWNYYELRSLYVKNDFRWNWIWWILLKKRMDIIKSLWKTAVMFANDLSKHWAERQWMHEVEKMSMPKQFFNECISCSEYWNFPSCHCKVYKK